MKRFELRIRDRRVRRRPFLPFPESHHQGIICGFFPARELLNALHPVSPPDPFDRRKDLSVGLSAGGRGSIRVLFIDLVRYGPFGRPVDIRGEMIHVSFINLIMDRKEFFGIIKGFRSAYAGEESRQSLHGLPREIGGCVVGDRKPGSVLVSRLYRKAQILRDPLGLFVGPVVTEHAAFREDPTAFPEDIPAVFKAEGRCDEFPVQFPEPIRAFDTARRFFSVKLKGPPAELFGHFVCEPAVEIAQFAVRGVLRQALSLRRIRLRP